MDESPHPHPNAPHLISLCQNAYRLYRQQGWAFTRPLLCPMLFQFVGAFLALIAPYRILNTMTQAGVVQDPVWLIGLTLLVLIPAAYLFTKGFWDYLVYMASLNVNVVEVLKGQPADFKKAYDQVEQNHSGAFTVLLMLLMSLWAFPLFALLLPTGFMMFLPPGPLNAVLIGVGVLLGLFFGLVCMVVSVYLCLSFQVFALEVPPLTPWGVLKRSFQLIDGHFWQAVGVLLGVMVLTNILIPAVVTLVFDVTRLTEWVASGFLQGLLRDLMDSVFPPQQVMVQYPLLELLRRYGAEHLAPLSIEVAHSLLYSLVTGLLLPLGTFFFACFYQGLASRALAEAVHRELFPLSDAQ